MTETARLLLSMATATTPPQLADGVGGGNAGDILPTSLDSETELKDTSHCELQLSHITRLEADCQTCEAVFLRLKTDCSAAKGALEAATERLRGYIRGLGIKMPLFDGGSNDSPAGERDRAGGEASVGSGAEAQAFGSPDGPRDGPAILASPGEDRAMRDGTSGVAATERLRGGSGFGEEDDESWKDANLGGIFPAGIAKKFEVEGIRTLGELSTFLNSGKTCNDIRGIGPAKHTQVEDCLEAFWKKWEAGN